MTCKSCIQYLLALLVILCTMTFFGLKFLFMPHYDGKFELEGAFGTSEVFRDEKGISHIYAKTLEQSVYT